MRPIRGSRLLRALCTMMLVGAAECAMAVDAAFVTAGGDRNIAVFGVGLSWAPWGTWPMEDNRILSLRGTASVSLWEASKSATNKSLIAVGAYPVLRLDMSPVNGLVPYIEASIGANVLSNTRIQDRRLSTAFQFGEYIGVGAAFGDKRQFDIGARYQHISNADIKNPNDGLSYASIVFQYRFD
jgi:lipid A 3-O-deacylase